MATSSGVSVSAPHSGRIRTTIGSVIRAREFGILAFLILVSILIGMVRSTFFTPFNLLTMGRQMAELTIMGVAMTFLITSQELDLSVGSVYGLCALTMAFLTKNYGLDLWISLFIVMILAVLIGLVNAFITTRGRIPAFIVTLGTLYILRGIALVESSLPIEGPPESSFYQILAGKVFDIPVQIFWMVGIVLIGWFVLQRTTFGYYVRATGSNTAAAALSGINVRQVKTWCFVLTAVAACFAGALSFAHLSSTSPTAGAGYELNVIAAVVIGGTALFGGQGTVIGTFLGAALLIVIRNGLIQIGGEGRLQEAFLGAIIIVAVLIHTHLSNRELRR